MKKIILFLSLFILTSTSFAFTDVKPNYWASRAITKWSNSGYLSGYPDGTFRGNNNITRAEMVSVINRLNNSKVETSKREAKDIKSADWFFNDMNKAAKLGLIFVNEDGKLRPKDKATREETIVVLARLLNISYSGNLSNAKINNFSDKNDISPENYRYIAGMVEEGFVNGYEDNTLRTKRNVTRAEFIAMIDNTIEYIYSSGIYDNKNLVGNVLINGSNVKLSNSQILGHVFVTDGAKEDPPILINTKVSKGVNSRVGKFLIKDTDEYNTVSNYNFEYPEEYFDPIFATIKYDENGWNDENIKVKVTFSDKDTTVESSRNNTVYVDKNGRHEIKYEQNGKIRTTTIDVNNIDKISPQFNASSEVKNGYAIIKVEIQDDGLSKISKISLSNGAINKLNEETGEINKEFIVGGNGKYTISVEDEAGNISKKDITIEGIVRSIKANTAHEGSNVVITVVLDDEGLDNIKEIRCSNGEVNKKDENGNVKNTFDIDTSGEYIITLTDELGNIATATVNVTI